MSEFNSDDHYIYYCGQESLRRNGVAIMVNKRVRNADFGCLADRGDPLAGTAGAPEQPSWRLGPGGRFFLGKDDIGAEKGGRIHLSGMHEERKKGGWWVRETSARPRR